MRLRGTQFVGPNGTPTPFNFGNVSGAFSNGGSGETAQSDLDHLTIPLHTFTFFEHARYKLTDDISRLDGVELRQVLLREQQLRL